MPASPRNRGGKRSVATALRWPLACDVMSHLGGWHLDARTAPGWAFEADVLACVPLRPQSGSSYNACPEC